MVLSTKAPPRNTTNFSELSNSSAKPHRDPPRSPFFSCHAPERGNCLCITLASCRTAASVTSLASDSTWQSRFRRWGAVGGEIDSAESFLVETCPSHFYFYLITCMPESVFSAIFGPRTAVLSFFFFFQRRELSTLQNLHKVS